MSNPEQRSPALEQRARGVHPAGGLAPCWLAVVSLACGAAACGTESEDPTGSVPAAETGQQEDEEPPPVLPNPYVEPEPDAGCGWESQWQSLLDQQPSCTADWDCVVVPTEAALGCHCGAPAAAVAREVEGDAARLLAQWPEAADSAQCEGYSQENWPCENRTLRAVCEQSRCVAIETDCMCAAPASDIERHVCEVCPQGSSTEWQYCACEAAWNEIQTAVEEVIAPGRCQGDDECAWLNYSNRLAGCGTAASTDVLDEAVRLREQLKRAHTLPRPGEWECWDWEQHCDQHEETYCDLETRRCLTRYPE